MTLPKHVIEAGAKALHDLDTPDEDYTAMREGWFKDGLREQSEAVIQAAFTALWTDDMEAAPRDGTRILLHYPGEGLHAGHWDVGTWQVPFWMAQMPQPTHWAPMLPLPKEGEE